MYLFLLFVILKSIVKITLVFVAHNVKRAYYIDTKSHEFYVFDYLLRNKHLNTTLSQIFSPFSKYWVKHAFELIQTSLLGNEAKQNNVLGSSVTPTCRYSPDLSPLIVNIGGQSFSEYLLCLNSARGLNTSHTHRLGKNDPLMMWNEQVAKKWSLLWQIWSNNPETAAVFFIFCLFASVFFIPVYYATIVMSHCLTTPLQASQAVKHPHNIADEAFRSYLLIRLSHILAPHSSWSTTPNLIQQWIQTLTCHVAPHCDLTACHFIPSAERWGKKLCILWAESALRTQSVKGGWCERVGHSVLANSSSPKLLFPVYGSLFHALTHQHQCTEMLFFLFQQHAKRQ